MSCLLDELLAIVDRIENLADRYRRSGVPADEAQTFLQLGPETGSSSQNR